MNNFINSDSPKSKNTLKWIRTSLDYIALGVVLVGGLYELQAGHADVLRDTPFYSMFHCRMHNNMLLPFDYVFANASLYLLGRMIGCIIAK